MKDDKLCKILVLGCPGSGKSYFSKKMSEIRKIPVYHLDLLYWRPNWTTAPLEEFRELVTDVVKRSEWIIDGTYTSTLDLRYPYANLVFFLDLPTEICLENVIKRHGSKRSDFPVYLEEKELDPEFYHHILNFKNKGREIILSFINKYPDIKVITFTSQAEIDAYLQELAYEAK